MGTLFVWHRVNGEMTLTLPGLYKEAYDAGYVAGNNNADWKKRALQDHKYTRNLCNAWWFDSSIKERKLK